MGRLEVVKPFVGILVVRGLASTMLSIFGSVCSVGCLKSHGMKYYVPFPWSRECISYPALDWQVHGAGHGESYVPLLEDRRVFHEL